MNSLDTIEGCFSYDILDSIGDCFRLPYKDDQERESYVSHIPKEYPNTILVGVQEGLDLLKMYTVELKEFYAPPELCLRKAIEILDEPDKDLALSVLRCDLNSRTDTIAGFEEVDSLIYGLRALVYWLDDYFIEYGLYIESKLIYVFDSMPYPGMMLLSKMTYCDGTNKRDIPQLRGVFIEATEEMQCFT